MKEIMRDQPIGRLGRRRRSPRPFFGSAAPGRALSLVMHWLSMAASQPIESWAVTERAEHQH